MRKPTLNSIAVGKMFEPRHIVVIQLNILTPVGTAIRKVAPMKKGRKTPPVVNM